MPTRFCDPPDPCPLLKKAAVHLLSPDYSGQGFEFIVEGKGGKRFRVFAEYCPFCGTRIDEHFLATLRVRK